MNNYYLKLDLKFNAARAVPGRKLFNYGPIHYSTIESGDLLEEIHTKFATPPTKCFYIEIYGNLKPHFDRGALSCLNYYIENGNFITHFYEISNLNYEALETVRHDNVTNSRREIKSMFKYEDLTVMDSLNAENNSCYLLNISKIHSVEKISKNYSKRTAIQLQWDCSYDELIDITAK